MNSNISLEAVMHALKKVIHPQLGKDLLSLNQIKDLRLGIDEISFKVETQGVSALEQSKLTEELNLNLNKVQGIKKVNINWQNKVAPTKSGASTPSTQIVGVKNIIAVSSGKGGVGKSTASVNLAVTLSKFGKKVGLMDADVYGPNIPTMLGVIDGPEVVRNAEGTELFIPPVAHGIKVMSMGFLISPDQPLVWRGPMLHSIVNQFCHQVEWGELDYLIVDMPPGTGDVQLSLAQLVPLTGTVLVTTPQEVALQDVRKAYYMWEKVRIPVLGVIENMSYFLDETGKKHEIFGSGGGEKFAQKFGIDLLGQVPLLSSIREGGDIGLPETLANLTGEVSVLFSEIVEKIMGKVDSDCDSKESKSENFPHNQIEIGNFN